MDLAQVLLESLSPGSSQPLNLGAAVPPVNMGLAGVMPTMVAQSDDPFSGLLGLFPGAVGGAARAPMPPPPMRVGGAMPRPEPRPVPPATILPAPGPAAAPAPAPALVPPPAPSPRATLMGPGTAPPGALALGLSEPAWTDPATAPIRREAGVIGAPVPGPAVRAASPAPAAGSGGGVTGDDVASFFRNLMMGAAMVDPTRPAISAFAQGAAGAMSGKEADRRRKEQKDEAAEDKAYTRGRQATEDTRTAARDKREARAAELANQRAQAEIKRLLDPSMSISEKIAIERLVRDEGETLVRDREVAPEEIEGRLKAYRDEVEGRVRGTSGAKPASTGAAAEATKPAASIPEGAISALRSNPALRAQFNRKYATPGDPDPAATVLGR